MMRNKTEYKVSVFIVVFPHPTILPCPILFSGNVLSSSLLLSPFLSHSLLSLSIKILSSPLMSCPLLPYLILPSPILFSPSSSYTLLFLPSMLSFRMMLGRRLPLGGGVVLPPWGLWGGEESGEESEEVSEEESGEVSEEESGEVSEEEGRGGGRVGKCVGR
jgi:hypothetical protein